MIDIDVFIEKGKHSICQDYAICGTDPFPYIILSDGCSASKDSDIGSRILTQSAKNFISYPKDYFINFFKNETEYGNNLHGLYNKMGLCVINNALNIVKLMSLDIECLDATLIISFIIDGILYVYMYGDGNILTIENEKPYYINIKFPSGAPFYLSYNLDNLRMLSYFERFENKKVEQLNSDVSYNYSCKHPMVYRFELTKDSTYLISSDGLNSFISKSNDVKLEELIPDMITFKNYSGRFIERRFKRFLLNLEKRGIYHFDDISVCGYHIGDNNEILCKG